MDEITYISEGKFYEGAFPEINRVDISLTQLRQNLINIRSMLKEGTKFLAVVKGDAYGHGLVPVSRALESFKCDVLGVVRLTEALALRRGGIKIPILMLAPIMPCQVRWIIEYDITPMVDNEKIINSLEKTAEEINKKIKVHVKINTGLNRYGITPEKTEEFITYIKQKCPHIIIEGIYTHFKSPQSDETFTNSQIDKFKKVLQKLELKQLRPQLAHTAGSPGILYYPESHFDMVRCGIILYGLEHKANGSLVPNGVQSIMTIKSTVIRIENIKAGDSTGYENEFVAERDMRIAIIGIGYGDGIQRGWKQVLIKGKRVSIISYFMDGIIADVTAMEDIKEFDEVVIIGKQGDECISWKEACRNINTYIDEQVQNITERVPRHYYYDKEDVSQ